MRKEFVCNKSSIEIFPSKNYQKRVIPTVSPCAISSSGTSSGRKWAGVIQGSFVLTGNKVTMMSPLAERNKKKYQVNCPITCDSTRVPISK